MEVLKISLVLMIAISLGSARFEIIDNPAALNVFHSDRQSTPVVGPPPKNQTSKDIEIRFHQCAMEFDFKHRELADIIDVYKQVMFGKNYAKECPAGSELNLIHYMGNGKKLIEGIKY